MPLSRSSKKTRTKVLLRGTTTVPVPSAVGTVITNVDVSSAGITDLSEVVEVNNGASSQPLQSYFTAAIRLTSTTNLRIETWYAYSSGSVFTVDWEIREAEGTAQRGYTTVNGSSSAEVTTNVSVADVESLDTAKVYYNGLGGPCAYGIQARVKLTSTTNLQTVLSEAYNTSSPYNIAWVIDY
jgi:hypothetical protein